MIHPKVGTCANYLELIQVNPSKSLAKKIRGSKALAPWKISTQRGRWWERVLESKENKGLLGKGHCAKSTREKWMGNRRGGLWSVVKGQGEPSQALSMARPQVGHSLNLYSWKITSLDLLDKTRQYWPWWLLQSYSHCTEVQFWAQKKSKVRGCLSKNFSPLSEYIHFRGNVHIPHLPNLRTHKKNPSKDLKNYKSPLQKCLLSFVEPVNALDI